MTTPGPYFTPEDVVEMFRLDSVNYVNENAKHWPHIRIARKLRFTQEHIDVIAKAHEQAPTVPTSSNTLGRRTRGGAA